MTTQFSIRLGLGLGLAISLMATGVSMAQAPSRVDQARPGTAPAPATQTQTNPYYVGNALAGENLLTAAAPDTPGAVLNACRARDAAACRTAMAAVTRRDGWTDCGRDLPCPSTTEREASLANCDRGQASSCDLIAVWLSRKGYDSWKAHSD